MSCPMKMIPFRQVKTPHYTAPKSDSSLFNPSPQASPHSKAKACLMTTVLILKYLCFLKFLLL